MARLGLLLIVLGIAFGVFAVFAIQAWWKHGQESIKEREQKARGRVPDKYLPPHLREGAQPQAQQESIVNRRMAPSAWQKRQEEIKAYWMEHPEERPR